ncbi:MAG: hypothetical protein ABIB55_02955, partial [Candidatus Nealsonbacteria bacterium]
PPHFSLFIKITMRIYVNKDGCFLIFEYVNCAPIARQVDAPLALSITRERMIIQLRVKWIFLKNKKAFSELPPDSNRNLFIALGKIPMKFYFHSEFR